MSLQWNKALRLRVTPDAVEGELAQGWLRREVVASVKHEVGAAGGAASAPIGPLKGSWRSAHQATFDAALRELGDKSVLDGMRLDIELDNAFFQFDVVQGDFFADSDGQLQAVAIACSVDLLGDSPESHSVRWQLQPDGRHLLTCAMAAEQLHALIDVAASHGVRLRSVQPDLCVQWNRRGASMRSGQAMFAVAQGRQAVLACVSAGSIVDVSDGGWLDGETEPPPAGAERRSPLGRAPSHQATTGLLDKRVDRLLAGMGWDPANQSAYVLVAPALPEVTVSERWTVSDRASSGAR